ncbi:MAG TPA: M23 family metallopeptidase [Candidatus Tidjanibacter gallistercoris]|nr:M23 family metallopeptidase [Candidatus Tidjanibacter gallistercoris]
MGRKKENNKIRTGFGYLMRNFTKKHRVSVRDRGLDREVWYMYISPMRMTLAILGVLLVMFAVVVTAVVYTPVLDSLPGYPGKKARELLIRNIQRLDSLENEIRIMQAYGDNVALIMEGRTPTAAEQPAAADTLAEAKTLVPPSEADSLLRAQLEGDGRFALVEGMVTPSGTVVRRMEFIAPVKGRVIATFDPGKNMFGTGVVPSGAQQVVAAQAGTVVMSQWTPEDGNTIQIQHGDNYISFYKHNSQLLKRVGDRVEAGEVIGYLEPGVVDNATRPSGEFIFELWADGRPVDPEKYVIFQ